MSSWHTSTDRSTGTSLGICATMLLWLGACSTGMATERLGHVGVDRPGGDLPNMPVSMPSFQAAPEDCAKLCLANTACSAWVFESAGTCRSSPLVVQDSGQPAAAKCWLKATLTSQRAHPCRVSRQHFTRLLYFRICLLVISISCTTANHRIPHSSLSLQKFQTTKCSRYFAAIVREPDRSHEQQCF